MTDNVDRALRSIQEKLELLTGERANGSRRAVLIGEFYGAVQDMSDANVSMKKVVSVLEAKFNSNIASITDELLVRADANSALAQKISTLRAEVNGNIAQIQETRRALATKSVAMAEIITNLTATVSTSSAEISTLKKVYADDKIAFATDITRVEATAGKKRSFRQTSAPANDTTNNLVVGDMWYDTGHANKPYYWTGPDGTPANQWVDVSNAPDLTNYALTSSVTDEAAARASADAAIAQKIISASAGTSRVYTQTTQPGPTGRQEGDVWIDASIPSGQLFPSYTPYVWHGGQWNNNSTGAYTQYVGQIASISAVSSAAYNGTSGSAAYNAQQTANGAKTTADASYNATGGAVATVKNKVDNQLGVQWALVGTIGGTSNNVLVVNGVKKADGTGGQYNLRIEANTEVIGTFQTTTGGSTVFSTYPANGYSGQITNFIVNGGTIGGVKNLTVISPAATTGIEVNATASGGASNGVLSQASGTAVWGIGGAGYYDFYATGAGANYGSFTGAHDAATSLDEIFENGDIVIDAELLLKTDISYTFARVTKSSSPIQKGVVGVIAMQCGLLSDGHIPSVFRQKLTADGNEPEENEWTPIWNAMKDQYNRVGINALGEGQINVCGENGDLEIGDLIVSSSIPGKGMKQDDDIIRSTTVAKARENVTFSSPTEVKMVACIYLCG